ncbi:MAG: T9SS type A sorting domain-containing protein [Bacteroidetes bacterium]|nr:T9SS type A sorting domain-containing protein [Bacteroidota bacterium]
MKKFLPLIAMFFYGINSNAQVLINENFSGYSAGNLVSNGTPAWAASSSGVDLQVVTSADNGDGSGTTGNPLVYPGYGSGTNYITTSKNSIKDETKNFLGNQSITATGTTFFYSFVVRADNTGDINTSTSGPAIISLKSGATLFGSFYLRYSSFSSGSLRFGINKGSSTSGTSWYTLPSGTSAFSKTHLVVIRYDVASGTNNDKMYIWVDPTDLTTELLTTSANISLTSGADPSLSSVTALQISQNSSNGTTANWDAFKVGAGTTSAQAWDNLGAAGTILPVKFGTVTAASKGSGVEVNWQVYSESNVSHYEVERSSDGMNFNTIGLVVAKNIDGQLSYNLNDASPVNGTGFYRIKSVDLDGKAAYSVIVKVYTGKATAGSSMYVYPNPVKASAGVSVQFNELSKGNYQVQLFDASGKQVYRQSMSHSGGAITQSIVLPSSVKPGLYVIQVAGEGLKFNKSIIVQ